MNKDVKQLWVTALRSGDYTQGRRTLRYEDADGNNRWCCLGVLCDLAVKAGIIGEPTRIVKGLPPDARDCDGPWEFLDDYDYDGYRSDLPKRVQEWAGLEEAVPTLRGSTAIELNDHLSMPFPEIADRIEESL